MGIWSRSDHWNKINQKIPEIFQAETYISLLDDTLRTNLWILLADMCYLL